jgi:hypothetical protein
VRHSAESGIALKSPLCQRPYGGEAAVHGDHLAGLASGALAHLEHLQHAGRRHGQFR